MQVDTRRIKSENDAASSDGSVLYWMSRDQRIDDNWAFLYAYEQSRLRNQPLIVAFVVLDTIQHTSARHFDFVLKGLQEVEERCQELKVLFVLTVGDPAVEIPRLVTEYAVGEVVTDCNPLRNPTKRRKAVATEVSVACSLVDAHNIVPVWEASPKEEFAAHTFRPKIHRLLPEFLTDFPTLKPVSRQTQGKREPIDWDKIRQQLSLDERVAEVDWLKPGGKAVQKTLTSFLHRLPGYAENRNDPNQDALSNLSPYLHYGQISAQRVALAVQAAQAPKVDKEAFLEELIVRRELADNFCFYNKSYDKISGAHEWAQKTINVHQKDKREYVYTRAQFENAMTHDELWNAMQTQMVSIGKMHGWCRMYWAKKILEWSKTHQEAINIALYLNNKYELDGRDPNGVVGIMWSMCGVHDRAWAERPVFGKIRYMNYNGAKRKFDVAAYIAANQ